MAKNKLISKYGAGVALMVLGGALLIGSAGLLTYNALEDKKAAGFSEQAALNLYAEINRAAEEREYESWKSGELDGGYYDTPEGAAGIVFPESIDDEPSDGKTRDMPFMVVDGREYIGVLNIPSLDRSLPLARVWDYPTLRLSPCRYTGSYFEDNLSIVAHNYGAHFLGIENLEPGAEAFITDVLGADHIYKFAYTETVTPTSIDKVVDNNYDLTLVTCNYSGQARILACFLRAEG